MHIYVYKNLLVSTNFTEIKTMKKICYVTTIALSIKSFFLPQLTYLADNGFDVTVICSPDDELPSLLDKRIHFIPVKMPRGFGVKKSFDSIKELFKIFKREKFDLVQYSTPNAALYSSVSSAFAGIKRRNYHLMGFRYIGSPGFEKKLLKIFEKIACLFSTSVECVSPTTLQFGLDDNIFPKKKATIVWNGSTGGVDMNRFDIYSKEKWRKEIREKYNIKEDDFVFGFVGRITRDKGINELFNAYCDIRQGNTKLFLVGPVEYSQTLEENLLDDAEKSEDIIMTGMVNDVEKYYAAMDVLVLPSYREGFGNVVIEAGSLGVASIITRIPGLIDTVEEGVSAYVVPLKDTKSLAETMKKFRTVDAEKMGKDAYYYVKTHFDGNTLNEKILARKKLLLKK